MGRGCQVNTRKRLFFSIIGLGLVNENVADAISKVS